jgi:hypothetical protein
MGRTLRQVGAVVGVLLIPVMYAEAQSQCPTWAWVADNHTTESGNVVSYFTDNAHKFSTYVNGDFDWYWDDPDPGTVSLRGGGVNGRGFMFSDDFGENLSVNTGITVAARINAVSLASGGDLCISVANGSTSDQPDEASTHIWLGWDYGPPNGNVIFYTRGGSEVRTFQASKNIQGVWSTWTLSAKKCFATDGSKSIAWDLWIDGVPQAQDQPAQDGTLHTVIFTSSTDMGTSVNIGERDWIGGGWIHETAWDYVAIYNGGVIPGWRPLDPPTWTWQADNHSLEGTQAVSYFTDGTTKYLVNPVGDFQWYWDDPEPGTVSLRGEGGFGRGFMWSDPDFGESLSVDTGISVAARIKPVSLASGGDLCVSVANSSTADQPDEGSIHVWLGWDYGPPNGNVIFYSRSGGEVRTFQASTDITNHWSVWTLTAKECQAMDASKSIAWDLWIDCVPQAQDQTALDGSRHTVIFSSSTDMGNSVNIGERDWMGGGWIHDTGWDWVAINNTGAIPAWSPDVSVKCASSVSPVDPQNLTARRGQAAVPPGAVYTVSNTGTSSGLTYTVAETDATGNTPVDYPWLELSKTSGGPLDPTANDTVSANVVDTTAAPGQYTGYITITDACTPARKYVRQINLTIIGCEMHISPESGVYRAALGTTKTVEDVVYTLANTGAGDISYTVEKTTSSPWLSLSKTAGGPIPSSGTDQVTASISLTGLAEGTYSCQLKFTPDCTEPPALPVVYRTVHLSIRGASSTTEWLNAEFTEYDFLGKDLEATSPLNYCPGGAQASQFVVTSDNPPADEDWLFLSRIDGILTSARFSYDGSALHRATLSTAIPLNASYDPAKGMAVAYRMRTGQYDGPVRGPIKIWTDARPRWEGAFEVYIGIYQGTRVRPMMECCGAPNTLLPEVDELVLPEDISSTPEAPVYHTWSVSSCYDRDYDPNSAYYNVWLDGKQLFFGGINGTVDGPGSEEGFTVVKYSFRNQLDPNEISDRQFQADATAGIELGEENNQVAVPWDFEFDWVRVLTLDVPEAPYWDGTGGCEPSNAPWPDVNEDGAVDQADFAVFQLCYTGDLLGVGSLTDPTTCRRFDRDHDNDVDQLDYGQFEQCATGPGVTLSRGSPPAGCEL